MMGQQYQISLQNLWKHEGWSPDPTNSVGEGADPKMEEFTLRLQKHTDAHTLLLTHTDIWRQSCSYILTHLHACTHKHIHTYTHSYSDTHFHILTHMHTLTYTHTLIYGNTDPLTCTLTFIYLQTCSHALTYIPPILNTCLHMLAVHTTYTHELNCAHLHTCGHSHCGILTAQCSCSQILMSVHDLYTHMHTLIPKYKCTHIPHIACTPAHTHIHTQTLVSAYICMFIPR